MKKKICVVTSSRAEYSLLKNLLFRLKKNNKIKLHIVCSGTHLSKRYGKTLNEIEKDNLKVNSFVNIVQKKDTPNDICKSFSKAIDGFSSVYKKVKPDCIIYLGDRYEILAAAYAALIHNIPKIHIHGGELTEGIIDDATRHSISKISDFHFVSHQQYKKRVIQLGEHPSRVFLIGAMAIENIKKEKILSLYKLSKNIGFKLNNEKKNILITLHPVNLNKNLTRITIVNLLKILKNFKDYKLIFTYPNQDTYGNIIIKHINYFKKKNKNVIFIKNLGSKNYYSAIEHSFCVIGNSSSGILEVPSFKTPTINLGNRQRGRVLAKSVIQTNIDKKSIYKALKKAKSLDCTKFINPFDQKKKVASVEINKLVTSFNFKNLNLEKKFYDL
ncbi:UDP-N-acetylglucosamine 2-epimerase [Candidatus Pelagibacter sp.]|nr:UDP-N-acetylglucosamine 2-epimerase [Candidatus Pelagibacter sp.]